MSSPERDHSRSLAIACGSTSSGSAMFGSHAFSHSSVTHPLYPTPRNRVRNVSTFTSPSPSFVYVAPSWPSFASFTWTYWIRLFSVGTDTCGDSPTIAALNTSQQHATDGCWRRSRIDHISLA